MKYLISILIVTSGFSKIVAQNMDISVLRRINLGGNESFDPAFKFITNSVTPLALIAPTVFFTAYMIKKDSSIKRKTIFFCSSFIISGIITTALKYSINRPRPFKTYPDIKQEASAGNPSFPSGHTSGAFSLATCLSIAFSKCYVIAPSFLWASTVAYSRMDLGVHYPSDVIAGAIAGSDSGSAFLSYKLNNGWQTVSQNIL